MRPIGPETDADRKLREWFDEQERRNLDRLEEGAKTLIQLVTGLYGVLFAVLALKDDPAYLQQATVLWLGTGSLFAFFIALLAALGVVYPWRSTYQEDNLSAMRRAQNAMLRRKVWGLRLSLVAFVVGAGLLAGVILAVLWGL
jgi:hypothetical protein